MPSSAIHSSPPPVPWPARLAIALAAAILFYALRHWAVPGGDTAQYLETYRDATLRQQFWDGRWVYNRREPLSYALVQMTYRLLTHDLSQAFYLVGAACGGIYVALLLGFTRHAGFLLVNLATGATFQFVGHIEFYAPVTVALLWYHLELIRAARDPARSPVRAAVAFFLAAILHKVALFYAPAMLWFLFERRDGRLRTRPWPTAHWAIILACLVLPLAVDSFGWTLHHMNLIWLDMKDDSMFNLITPLTAGLADARARGYPVDMLHNFTLATPAHWRHYLTFLFAGAPLGVVATLVFRRRLRGPVPLVLATSAACGLLWMFLIHPHRGLYDWDLFILGALPLNILGAALWSGRMSASPAVTSRDSKPQSSFPAAC